jgi:hypothetical protein
VPLKPRSQLADANVRGSSSDRHRQEAADVWQRRPCATALETTFRLWFTLRRALARAVSIQRVGGEDSDADQGENSCWEFDHCSASLLRIAARNLPRDWFQMRLKKNCMTASLFH